MLFFRPKEILVFFYFFVIINSHAQAMFSEKDCLGTSFSVNISHNKLPFGLLKNKLLIDKDQCQLKISHQKYFIIRSNWIIDVCRGPIHFKKGFFNYDVLRLPGLCNNDENLDQNYCKQIKELFKVIQDDGLVFASGEKENLETEHGHVYCSYQLLQKYLLNGLILSLYDSKAMNGLFFNEDIHSKANPTSEK